MAKELLDEESIDIRSAYVPLLVNHDFSQQVGVVLNARVIDLGDGEHALLVVTGIFEDERESSNYPNGAENVKWQDTEPFMDEVERAVRTEYGTWTPPEPDSDVRKLSLTERLGLFFNSTEVMDDGTLYLIKKHVESIEDLSIDVYADHDPPHFHVKSRQKNFDIRFHLDSLEIYSSKRGNITNKDARKVQEYFRSNPDEHERLKRDHRSMNPPSA